MMEIQYTEFQTYHVSNQYYKYEIIVEMTTPMAVADAVSLTKFGVFGLELADKFGDSLSVGATRRRPPNMLRQQDMISKKNNDVRCWAVEIYAFILRRMLAHVI